MEQLSAADAQMDGLLLDATSGLWYDPNAVVVSWAPVVAADDTLDVLAEPASSFVAVQTRPLRGSPYDRAEAGTRQTLKGTVP